jgi:hypothetical protein
VTGESERAMPEMPTHQRAAIILASIALVVLIFELVRKRRLREEYSWIWMLTGLCVLTLAFVPQIVLTEVAHFFGTQNPPAAIFFTGFCFVALVCLQFSVRLSRMTEHVKTLAQKIALLEADLEKERGSRPRD